MPLISRLASRTTLDRITIRVGENRRRIGGLPAGWVLWEGENWEVVRMPQRFSFLFIPPLTFFQWEAERDSFGKMLVTFKKGRRPSRTFLL